MKRISSQVILGFLLIAAGALFLLQNLGFLDQAGSFFWAIAFAAGGIAFLYSYMLSRTQWWPLIPGFTFLGIGLLIGLEALAPRLGDVLGAPIFLGLLSAGFWVVYLQDRGQWWAIIPGGVLLSTAVFVGLEALIPGADLVGVFFLGMGATFIAVALLPRLGENRQWAFIPGGVLVLMGFIFLASSMSVLKFLGPAALVLAGLYLVARTLGLTEGGGTSE